jgi:hypothetical protein
VQVDALAVRLRPRTPTEAADLGVRLCQATAPAVYRCYAIVFLPIAVVSAASSEIASWLPVVVIWWSKPWLDRTILFVLSRAAFGQSTTFADVWRARREVWWRQWLFTLTVCRLSLWRSLTQPVYQLEGAPAWIRSDRVRQIRQRTAGAAFILTQTFAICEGALYASLLSLVFWFAPAGSAPDVMDILLGESVEGMEWMWWIASCIAVLFLEPYYVAAGFGMYLNRRAELEAWDIEQELRRVFA